MQLFVSELLKIQKISTGIFTTHSG